MPKFLEIALGKWDIDEKFLMKSFYNYISKRIKDIKYILVNQTLEVSQIWVFYGYRDFIIL